MSRREQVKYFNIRQLSSIKSEENAWDALDSARKLRYSDEDRVHPRTTQILRDLETHKESLKDHRLPTTLVLKVGAKVVLLSNLNPKGGLVNGSQGEVVKFVDTKNWPVKELEGKGKKRLLLEQAKIDEFQASRGFLCPIVRFTNGKIVTIQPIVQESLRGLSYDRYLVSRTQIPLTLAWALSIHKSQGMTLEHVEVSSNDIFESGQLYVGFSRATKLDGLTVTGYSRAQLSPDEDVLEFYNNAPWEDLGPSNESKARADTTIEFKAVKELKSV
jgi:ATP-dependent DNA helicase PIF1